MNCWSWCNSPAWAIAIRTSCPAASASAWLWRVRWRSSLGYCCWTSRSAHSMPRCARNCGSWLRELHHKTGVTTIFVTHDQEEALELADRVVIMSQGAIAQAGTVDQVYEHPASPLVFDFLGSTNIIPATLSGGGLQVGGEVVARLAKTTLADGPVDIYVRPGDLRATGLQQAEGLLVRIREVHRTGPVVRVTAAVAGTETELTIELPHLHHDVPQFQAGANLRLRLLLFSVFRACEKASTSPAAW